MADLDAVYGVDDRTRAFENHQRGILVSLAGPGTGKTYSMLGRVNALVAGGATPDTICYLTFIKEISTAFVADYIDRCGEESFAANAPRISTLHSFACRLLRNQGFTIGYEGELYFMSVADSKDGGSDVFLADLLHFAASSDVHTPAQLRAVLEQIKEGWRNGVEPSTLPDSCPSVLNPLLALSRAYRLVDWDQTIPVAYNLLSTLREPPEWIGRIKHYLVDEYQDFNIAEQRFIDRLATLAVSTVIVGDDDQSLYSQRGGSPAGLRDLVQMAQHDRVSLVRCRRCPSTVVAAANTFLSTMRSDPRLMLPHTTGGEIVCRSFKSAKAELKYLEDYLAARVSELPPNPRPQDGCICLFPSWKALQFYFERLSPRIACRKKKSAPHPVRIWLERVLYLIARPDQRFVQRLLLESFTAIKPRHKNLMLDVMIERDISPGDAFQTLVAEERLKGNVAANAMAFGELLNALASKDAGRIAAAISGRLPVDDATVMEALGTFIANLDDPEQREEAMSSVCDLLVPDSAEPVHDAGAVEFLTIHGSKGLTRHTVVMPGLEEAWLPGPASGSDLSEKQRLFYVGLTRATHLVLITCPRTRAAGDPLNYPAPGRSHMTPFAKNAGIGTEYIR